MKLNLTPAQKALACWIVETIREKGMAEIFQVMGIYCQPSRFMWFANVITKDGLETTKQHHIDGPPTTEQELECLASEHLLLITQKDGINTWCQVRGRLYSVVDSNFEDSPTDGHFEYGVRDVPIEISISSNRFKSKFPNAKKIGFLIMRFSAAKPFQKIVEVIKETVERYGITVVRADENEFHADLWGNVRTHLHGCSFGIAVYERIESEEPNANIGLEVGYLMAMNKPVLLLKDKTVQTVQADLAGKLYKPFDPHNPEGTIPAQLTKWLEDYGIIVPDRN